MAGLAVGSIYALMALAMNLVFAARRIVNFAHGDLVMIAGLAGFTAMTAWGWPYLAGLVGVSALVAALAAVLERVAVRPLPVDESNISWILSTLAAAIILQNSSQLIWGTDARPFPPLFATTPVRVAGINAVPQEIATLLVAVILMGGFHYLQNRTMQGKAMKAVARDAQMAALLGINVQRMIAAAFAVSGLLATVAGFLISPMTFASAHLGFMLGLKGFAAAALGGLGSFGGAVVGGFVLGLAESLASGYMWFGARDVVALFLLIAILLFRPTGLVGELRIVKV